MTSSSYDDDDDDYITSYGYEPAEYTYDTADSRKSDTKISYARNSFGRKTGKSNANAKGGQAAGSYYSYYRQRSITLCCRHLQFLAL